METLEIHADAREKKKKREAKRLLRGGKIPGILYGPKMQSVALEFDQREFSNRIAGLEGSHLVRLKSATASLADKVALVKEMQYHPISGDVIHADLYEVDLTAKITVHVPLHFVGKAAGVSLITYYSSTVATRAVINRQEMAARWEHRAVGDGQSCANTAGVI